MKLNTIGTNQTEIVKNCGTVIFYSYNTPVAAMLPSGCYIKTNKKYSRTTTKHVNNWLKSVGNVESVDQSIIDRLS